ncbi:unannotated protein [freshwater metagenome]|uniref:Unannotated protein n=1 Tax=freshwater metagenome TaxID=449393 RepID=A0A6J6LDV1_9ZZZZ|nr:MFS transporter [Actinomycetota bacterium]
MSHVMNPDETPKSIFTALKYPNFRRLWISSIISSVSDQVFPICATMVLLGQKSEALAISLLLSLRVIAYLIFSPLGGVFADRLSRMRIIQGGLLLRSLLCFQLFFFGHTPTLLRLSITVFIMGVIEAGTGPAGAAIIPDLVDRDVLQSANALRAVTGRIASISGPGIAVALVALTSPRSGFLFTAVGLLLAPLALRGLKLSFAERGPHSPFRQELTQGYQFVKRTRWMLPVMICIALQTSVLFGAEMVLLPIITTREFGTASVYPMAIMSLSLGSLITAAFASRLRTKYPGRWSFAAWSLIVFLLIALIFPISPIFVIICYFIGGAATEPMGVLWQTAIQKNAPGEIRARVMSFDSMVSSALMPIGVGLAGPMSRLVGENAYMAGASVIFALLCVLILFVPGVSTFSTPK